MGGWVEKVSILCGQCKLALSFPSKCLTLRFYFNFSSSIFLFSLLPPSLSIKWSYFSSVMGKKAPSSAGIMIRELRGDRAMKWTHEVEKNETRRKVSSQIIGWWFWKEQASSLPFPVNMRRMAEEIDSCRCEREREEKGKKMEETGWLDQRQIVFCSFNFPPLSFPSCADFAPRLDRL